MLDQLRYRELQSLLLLLLLPSKAYTIFPPLCREELDRRTTETQKLQDEVENATKLTLERFGCAYGIPCSQRQSCLNGNFNVCEYWPHQIIIHVVAT